MTFTISPGCDWRYLTKEVGEGKENYYLQGTSRGEPAGIWQGAGAEQLGLTGEVDEQTMEAVFGYFVDPRSPEFAELLALPLEQRRARFAEMAKLGRAPRKFANPDEILKRKLVAEPEATPERVEQLKAQAGAEARHARSFFDLTFSPPKSVTILHTSFRAQELAAQRAGNAAEAEMWGRRAERVEQAISAGNNAGIGFWSKHAGYSRAGYHGRKDPDGASVGRYVDGHDWVAPAFFQHTSRAGDPQLHIHNPILNRVQNPDGQWRTLDSRALHRVRPAAAAVAERVMFEKLVRDLGVSVAMRPDGKSLEVTTVPQEARDLFSTRRRAITEGVTKRVEAFKQRYGREPNALELSRLSVAETLSSRPGKSADVPTLAQELDQWSARLRSEVDLSMSQVANQSVNRVDPDQLAEFRALFDVNRTIKQALSKVQEKKATWTRYDLIRALNDHLPGCLGGLEPDHVQNLLEELADRATRPDPEQPDAGHEVIRLTAPDLVPAPGEYRRQDGRSQFEAPTSDVYTTIDHLQKEERLTRAAAQAGAPQLPPEQVDAVLDEAAQAGRPLGEDQAAAVRGILTSGRRVEVLIGLAGSGKSYTVSTLARAWEQHIGGRVFGVGPSEQAVRVLQAEGLERSLNFKRWLDRHDRIEARKANAVEQQWQLRPGDLVVVDEAGMMATDVLDRIRRRVEAAGAKLLAAGDDGQMRAVGPGGALRLLTHHAPTYKLAEVRRMAAEWEREASARLRDRDPDVVAVYDRHGRVVDGGTIEQTAEAAGQAWLAATLRGERALLIVDTNQHAAGLSDQLRAKLVDLGRVEEGGERIGYREDDTGERLWAVAGVGDVIEARHNNWGLTGLDGKSVLNHNLYKVVGRPGNGALQARQITYDDQRQEQLGPVVTLPAEYLRENVMLGYAVTVHSGQGATIQKSYQVVTQRTSAAALYTGGSRGIEENTWFVETLHVGELERERGLEPGDDDDRRLAPAGVMASILERDEPDRPAVEVEQANLEFAGSLANLGAQWTTAIEDLTHARHTQLADQLVADGKLTEAQRRHLDPAVDEAAGPLWRLVRSAELAGHDPAHVIDQAVTSRELGTARSVAEVLHYRLNRQLEGKLAATADTYTDRTPQADTPVGQWARDLAEAMETRVGEHGETVLADPPEWATRRLGPVPDEPLDRADWTARAGRIAAYREQHLDQADPVDAIGPCPPAGAAEARAGWYAAWRALGEPEDRRAEAEMTVEQLQARIDAHTREKAWEPDWVGDELQTTALAEREHRTQATLLHAQAQAETDPDRRAELVFQASSHRGLALELEQARQQLEQINEARGRWYLTTAETRNRADAAGAELKTRGVDPDQPTAGAAGDTTEPATSTTSAAPDLADHTTTTPEAAPATATPAHAAVGEQDHAVAETAPPWAAAGLQRPAGVPAPAEVAAKVQRANEAVRTMAERERAEQEEAEQREQDLAADQQRQQRDEADRADAPTLSRLSFATRPNPRPTGTTKPPPAPPPQRPSRGSGRRR